MRLTPAGFAILLSLLAALTFSMEVTHDCAESHSEPMLFIPWSPYQFSLTGCSSDDYNGYCATYKQCKRNEAYGSASQFSSACYDRFGPSAMCCEAQQCSALTVGGGETGREGACMLPEECNTAIGADGSDVCGKETGCCAKLDPAPVGIQCPASYVPVNRRLKLVQNWRLGDEMVNEFFGNRQTNFLPYFLDQYEYFKSDEFCPGTGDCTAGNYLAFSFQFLADLTTNTPSQVFQDIGYNNAALNSQMSQLLNSEPYNGYVTQEYFREVLKLLWAEDGLLQLQQYNSGSCSDWLRMGRALYGNKSKWTCDKRWEMLISSDNCKPTLDSNLDDCAQNAGICYVSNSCPEDRAQLTEGDAGCQALYGSSGKCCAKRQPLTDNLMTFVDNEYHNVRVVIEPNVPESQQLLDDIEAAFTNTSQALYEATRHRAGFHSVVVYLPDSWSPDLANWQQSSPNLRNPEFTIKRDLSFQEDGVLATERVTMNTLQLGYCGSRGLGTQLTEKDLRGPQSWKNLAKHFGFNRYGTFSEHAKISLENVVPGEGIVFNRCVDDGTAFVRPCSGEYEIRNSESSASLNSISDFNKLELVQSVEIEHLCESRQCDPNTLHNDLLENDHNRICDGSAVFPIVLESDDLHDAVPRRRQLAKPQFRFVHSGVKGAPAQPNGRNRVVVVLDQGMEKSGLSNAKESAMQFVDMTDPSISTAVVGFDYDATVLAGLTVGDKSGKRALKTALQGIRGEPATTCIQSGVKAALELFKQDQSVRGGTLLLMSDGKDSCGDFVEQTKDEVRQLGLTVHTCSMAGSAEDEKSSLKLFAKANGGEHFMVQNPSDALQFLAFMQQALAEVETDGVERVVVFTDMVQVQAGQEQQHQIYLDNGLGSDNLISLLYGKFSLIAARLVSPDGSRTVQCQDESEFSKANCYMDFKPEAGYWTLSVTVQGSDDRQSVAVSVSSKIDQTTESGRTFRVDGRYAKAVIDHNLPRQRFDHSKLELEQSQLLMATVAYGPYAVMGATVEAVITHQNGDVWRVPLRDDGKNMDVHADDGLYSGEFDQTQLTGTYSITIEVNGEDSFYTGDVLLGIPKPESWMQAREHLRVPAKFTRQVAVGTFDVVDSSDKRHEPLPGRVAGLKLINQVTTDREAVLTLAWPSLSKQPKHYELVASTERMEVVGRSELLYRAAYADGRLTVRKQVQPSDGQQSALVETVRLPLDKVLGEKVYFSVSAVNQHQAHGVHSNVVIERVQLSPGSAPAEPEQPSWLERLGLHIEL